MQRRSARRGGRVEILFKSIANHLVEAAIADCVHIGGVKLLFKLPGIVDSVQILVRDKIRLKVLQGFALPAELLLFCLAELRHLVVVLIDLFVEIWRLTLSLLSLPSHFRSALEQMVDA